MEKPVVIQGGAQTHQPLCLLVGMKMDKVWETLGQIPGLQGLAYLTSHSPGDLPCSRQEMLLVPRLLGLGAVLLGGAQSVPQCRWILGSLEGSSGRGFTEKESAVLQPLAEKQHPTEGSLCRAYS